MARKRKRRANPRVPHEPGNLPMRIKLKLDDKRFADLVVSIAAYAINNALSPSDIIDASLGSIHHLEMFSYRLMQKETEE